LQTIAYLRLSFIDPRMMQQRLAQLPSGALWLYCLLFLLIRLVLEIPVNEYLWNIWQPSDGFMLLSTFALFLPFFMLHPVAMFFGVFLATLFFLLTSPFLWKIFYFRTLKWQQIAAMYCLVFAWLVFVGPIIRLVTFRLGWLAEPLTIGVLMGAASYLSFGWSKIEAFFAGLIVEAAWLSAVVIVALAPTLYLLIHARGHS
jgi:hypothetical protein